MIYYAGFRFDNLVVISLFYLSKDSVVIPLSKIKNSSISGMKVDATAVISGSKSIAFVESCPFVMKNLQTFHFIVYLFFPPIPYF